MPEKMSEKWSFGAKRAIETIFNEITSHPFITELMNGTLPREKFLFYLAQDALYLTDYGRALAGIAAKTKKTAHTAAFLSFAKDAMEVEKELHKSFLGSLDALPQMSPANLLYTSYLLRQLSYESTAVAVATVLPCFWIYKAVGDYIALGKVAQNNPYQIWINTYGGEEFGAAADLAMTIGDELAESATAEERKEMTEAFVMCSKLEWMFWDSAYKTEEWAV